MMLFQKKEKNILQEKLEERMFGLFDQVIEDRGKYYSRNSDKIPVPGNVPSIVSSYANQNAVISGGSGLVPGPMGMLTIVPELALVIRNQLSMVYDIGVAYGYGKKLTSELLIGVFGYALGSGALGLLAIHGQKVLVRRASLQFMQKVVQLMAGKVTQRVLKSMVSKWLPIAGAIALATWSKLSTHLIAERAISIFEKEIEISEETVDEESLKNSTDISNVDVAETNFEITKIQSLIQLMCVDGVMKEEEKEFIKTVISDSGLDEKEKSCLLEQVHSGSKTTKIDYSQISELPDEAIGLMVDLLGLAKRDGEFHITEKLFIKQVGKLLGFSADEIEEILTA